ncbi:glycosyltransferase family 8 protein [Pseudohoeflea coraliihabitans]|uniref:Glycosyltransferase family 8 protein n=1 Tax=Pseudohoeflea coraliihabitans TaxID=2860393 RepID=A0ABS6WSQ8_9HYPH|nr:glycosyltransferase family 8 protein [Pseudohoeflea sp. DP4N28-3]MBW3099002.1 glycosyltransferase family 8 protein [Pseudohoeflea sp. DP4N28-3]
MKLLFTLDANMVSPLAACLRSISISNRGANPTIYIAYCSMPDQTLDRLKSFCSELRLTCHFIPFDDTEIKKLRATMRQGHISEASLMRCFIARILPADVGKILYVDCDTLVLGPLAPLFASALGDNVAMALRTPMAHLEDMGVPEDRYFNTGVMLINLDGWRSAQIENRLLDVMRTQADRLEWWDQCALNIVLTDTTVEMDRRYNYIFSHTDVPDSFAFPVIVHYAGSRKPWTAPLRHPWGGLYFEMSSRTPWPPAEFTSPDLSVPLVRRYRRRLLKALGLRDEPTRT